MVSEIFQYGTPKALAANAFEKTGYTFAGWALNYNATDATYKDKESVSFEIPAITMYAVWKPNILTFSLASINNDSYISTGVAGASSKISVEVPYGTTDVSSLIAVFTVPDGCSVTVGSATQTSETTVNDFSLSAETPLVYKVVAANGCAQEYNVTVMIKNQTTESVTLPKTSSITIKSINIGRSNNVPYSVTIAGNSNCIINFLIDDNIIYTKVVPPTFTGDYGFNFINNSHFLDTAAPGTYVLVATITDGTGNTYSDSKEFTVD